MFAALGRFAYRRRHVLVAVWAVAFVLGLLGTARLPEQLKGGGFTRPGSPSQVGQGEMRDRLGFGPAQVTVVFSHPQWRATDAAYRWAMRTALADITPEELPGLMNVLTAAGTGDTTLVSRDGHAALAVLEFDLTTEQVERQVAHIRRLLRDTPLDTAITGEPAVYLDIQEVSARDLHTAEMYTLPVALLVLLLVFGTLAAAALPVVGGGVSVTVTLGSFYLLARAMDLSIFAMNSATLLGLAVGIDYALFMVGRFREELDEGRPVSAAVEATVASAGRAIFFSGVAVVVGLLGLMLVPYMALRSISLGGSLVVVVSVLAALTLLPALLGMFGPRVNALALPWFRGGESRFWRRWSGWVMRHPLPVLAVTVAALLLLAWPTLRLEADIPGVTSLPGDVESRRGYDVLQDEFEPGALSPIQVVYTWDGDPDALDPANLEALFSYGERLEALPGVRRVVSVVNLPGVGKAADTARLWRTVERPSPDEDDVPGALDLFSGLLGRQQRQAALYLRQRTTAPNAVLFAVVPEELPTSSSAQRLARRVLEVTPPPGARTAVAGVSLTISDYVTAVYDVFPWIVLFVVSVTFAVLLLFLHSLVLPLKAVVVNVLSLLAAFGVVVWVFQDGHLEWLLRFESSGSVDVDLPVLLFCTAFGVSMDYEVFLLSRMREAWLERGDNTWAVQEGLARTGRIVTSAALIIVVVAGSFAFTSIVVTKAIGVGLAVAVALDVTVVRVLMVPAAMRLIGSRCWWAPAWLRRRLPRVE